MTEVETTTCQDCGWQGQRWELHSTCGTVAICADCDLECGYTMKPVSEAA